MRLSEKTRASTMGFWSSKNKPEKEESGSEDSTSDVATIDFGEVLDISFAAKLHAQLKNEIEKNTTVNFVTSGLTRIDASCLQVLASFMGYAKENDIKVKWGEPSEVIMEATRLTGLTDVLELSN